MLRKGAICEAGFVKCGKTCGRVYAAAVILPPELMENPALYALNDSKKLTEKKRDELAEKIKELAIIDISATARLASLLQ